MREALSIHLCEGGHGCEWENAPHKSKKPVPTILDPDVKVSPVVLHMKAPSAIPRKSPRERIIQEDEYEKFVKNDTISLFDDMTQSIAPLGYQTKKYNDHIMYYQKTVTGVYN